jgi:hypothetical protein
MATTRDHTLLEASIGKRLDAGEFHALDRCLDGSISSRAACAPNAAAFTVYDLLPRGVGEPG